jgi:hypothetical protein
VVTHQTTPVNLRVSGNHSETIQFLLIESPQVSVVLGFSCLQRHNPSIDWSTGAIVGWSPFCHTHCLKSALHAPGRLPAESLDLWEEFSKAQATSLLQSRPVSKKVKPEALACRYSPVATPPEAETFPSRSKIISPSAVRPLFLRILPTFSVSRIKPMSHSPLSPVSCLLWLSLKMA